MSVEGIGAETIVDWKRNPGVGRTTTEPNGIQGLGGCVRVTKFLVMV